MSKTIQFLEHLNRTLEFADQREERPRGKMGRILGTAAGVGAGAYLGGMGGLVGAASTKRKLPVIPFIRSKPSDGFLAPYFDDLGNAVLTYGGGGAVLGAGGLGYLGHRLGKKYDERDRK